MRADRKSAARGMYPNDRASFRGRFGPPFCPPSTGRPNGSRALACEGAPRRAGDDAGRLKLAQGCGAPTPRTPGRRKGRTSGMPGVHGATGRCPRRRHAGKSCSRTPSRGVDRPPADRNEGGVVQELNAQATLVDRAGIDGGLTTTIARSEIEDASRQAPPSSTSTWGAGRTRRRCRHVDARRPRAAPRGGDLGSGHVHVRPRRDEQAFTDVEAHGLRGKAAVMRSPSRPQRAGRRRVGDADGRGRAARRGLRRAGSRAHLGRRRPVAVQCRGVVGRGGRRREPEGGPGSWQHNSAARRMPRARRPPRTRRRRRTHGSTTSAPRRTRPLPRPIRRRASTLAVHLASETGSSAASASGDSSVIGDVAPIVGAAGIGAVLLIAGAAFVTSKRRRIRPRRRRVSRRGAQARAPAAPVARSGRADSNRRPPAPKAGALPGCATPRVVRFSES